MSRQPYNDTAKRLKVQKRRAFSSGNVQAAGVSTGVRSVRKYWNVGGDNEGEMVVPPVHWLTRRQLQRAEPSLSICELKRESV